MTIDKGIVGHDGGGPGIVSWLYADPAAKTVAAVLTNAEHGVPVLNDITAPLYEAAGAKPFQADAAVLEKQATDARVDPHPYVGEYESVALLFRVIPHEEGIALRLRPIRDGHFTTGDRFVTFLNSGADGRMQHLTSRRRLHKRSG